MKTVGLNERQKTILHFIEQKIQNDGYPPSVREIAEASGLKSSSTAHAHLIKLEEMGYIKRDPTKGRAVIPVRLDRMPSQEEQISLPVVGKVAAGIPITATENIENYMNVPSEFVGNGTHFILKVQGNSMIEAGILNGDYIIIREQANAFNGDIVVAMIEDEATVKRYYKMQDCIELRPENSSMKPIVVNEVNIVGRVAGLLRLM
ncbi:MAG: transcriptional repressor LexA [Bacillota bacterium]|nr:transcriptional repressor LexA [Bacillota bacterium]